MTVAMNRERGGTMREMLIILCLATLTCASPQSTHIREATAEAALRAADQALAKAIASKSLEQTLSFYDADAITAGSAMPFANGPAELRKMWIQMFAHLVFSSPPWELQNVAVTNSGTIGYSSGVWITAKDSVWSRGKDTPHPYLTVWRKQANGQWKVLIDSVWY